MGKSSGPPRTLNTVVSEITTRRSEVPERRTEVLNRKQTLELTTQTSVQEVSGILTTRGPFQRTHHPQLGLIEGDDPCLEGNHEIIAGQPERSFNHHLSVGSGAPICDRLLPEGWYRFSSPAGSLLPTECPGGNYCGTQIPVWMKGSIPTVRQGVVATTACINQDRECCVGELDIAVRNCSDFVTYRLVPTPACNMGYCVGEGVPCPEGLASTNGYTPCDFTVKLDSVLLTQSRNNLQSEVIFNCLPVLRDVIQPSSIDIDVKWFVDGENVLSQTFSAGQQTSGSLPEKHWRLGQTIHCEAQAKHTVVGARTERLRSEDKFAGLVVSGGPLALVEGGPVQHLVVTSTVPVLCSPQDRALGHCCVELHLGLGTVGQEQYCPSGDVLHRVGLPSCRHKICRNDWNSSHVIPLSAPEDWLYNGDQVVTLEISTGSSSTSLWRDYNLPLQQVHVHGSSRTEQCHSDSSLTTFSGREYFPSGSGTYIMYRHAELQYEVQVTYRRCNLKKLCHCIVTVRVEDAAIAFDICSKGYLQVWAMNRNGKVSSKSFPEGLKLHSIDEGRAYQVVLPSGTVVSLRPYLSDVRIIPSSSDLSSISGLCGALGRNPRTGLQGNDLLYNKWRLEPALTLYSGHFPPPSNTSLLPSVGPRGCTCRHRSVTSNEISPVSTPSKCQGSVCSDPRAVSVLDKVIHLSGERGSNIPNLASLEGDDSEQVATVKVVGGPVLSRPKDGWTLPLARDFCSEYLGGSPALVQCRDVPGVILEDILDTCSQDVMFAGDSRAAQLQLDLLKETCRQAVTTNTSLWVTSPLHPGPSVALPSQEILDTLCLNDCNGHGQCSKGVCLCASDWAGPDCGVSLADGPRVANLENNGLCDVRSNPCRNFIVSGDNFADSTGLICHFEMFKIRGVASKQLVQDNALSSPATFISFQQVLCKLPTLEIHSNKERHRFDLKDNTDQTRMFVKVSVGYTLKGGRSTPLDLLLYDSQCWHCNLQGECNGKPNNKCVFSAATSSVQTFRIGKSITNGEGTDFHICYLPHDSGSCDRKEFRYFYNYLERRCKLFVYGGCKGNQNNFLSEIDCVRRCGDKDAVAALPGLDSSPQLQEIDQCSLVKDEGICPGNVPRFYFDKTAERCLLFSYGGCGGNTNNFQSEDSCISTCGGPSGALIHAIQLHGGLKPRKPICNLSINRGGCQAKLRRFYFDNRDETCKLFVFGGCQGNENNFETMKECLLNCGGPDLHAVSPSKVFSTTPDPLSVQPTTSQVATKRILALTTEPPIRELNSEIVGSRNISKNLPGPASQEIAFTSISLPSISPCGLPSQVGACNSFRERWYFDAETQKCKQFRFSGCGGNGNNFLTGENCVKNCGGSMDNPVSINHVKHITERLVLPTMKTTTTVSPIIEDLTRRKKKMKRVKIERGRGSQSVTEERSRAFPNRARMRSRMSSSSSVVSSSTEQSISQNELELPGVRRPARMASQSHIKAGKKVKEPLHKVKSSITDLYPVRTWQRHRKYIRNNRRVDEVMKAPPNMKGGLVIIRSYCRYPPDEVSGLCSPSTTSYFYNVTSATCESLSSEICTQSRNRFHSIRTCLESCIVGTEDHHDGEDE